jgi:hypothetical protein
MSAPPSGVDDVLRQAASPVPGLRPQRWHRLVREPIVHFALLGIALFAAYGWLNRDVASAASADRIVVTRAEVERLAKGFAARVRRAPSESELRGLVADLVREEMLVREALALGVDRDDSIVRRRLAQKVEFLLQDAANLREPSPQDLAEYFAGHAETYRVASRYTFAHVYFSEARRGTDAERAARSALASSRAGSEPAGDASLVDALLRDRTADDVAAALGPEFARAIATLPVGGWQGPVRSSYGWHLVRIDARVPGQLPPLAEVEERVRRDWLAGERARANAEAYERMRSRYTVVVEGMP